MCPQIRVLHVLGGASVGGVETFVRSVADTIDREHFALSVCIIGREGVLADHLRKLEIPTLCLDSTRFSLCAMGRFYSWVRAGRPHVLHTSVGGGRIRWLARFAGCRSIICHIHGPPDELAEAVQRRDPRLQPTIRNAYSTASDLVLTCSDWLGSSVSAIAPELAGRVQTLHCGIDSDGIPFGPQVRKDVRAVLGIPVDVPVLGFVGRLVRQKGIEELASVAGDWMEREPAGQFLVVGDGPLRPLLQVLHDQFAGRVHLAGQRVNASALIPAMDIMLVTSRWESFGIVNLEAMAACVPVIAFDVDGIAEVISHDHTGFLVRRGDVNAMGAAILTLMSSPARRAAIGLAGRRRVQEHFSLRRMVEMLCGYYEQLCR